MWSRCATNVVYSPFLTIPRRKRSTSSSQLAEGWLYRLRQWRQTRHYHGEWVNTDLSRLSGLALELELSEILLYSFPDGRRENLLHKISELLSTELIAFEVGN
jgi:hypothetical protein